MYRDRCLRVWERSRRGYLAITINTSFSRRKSGSAGAKPGGAGGVLSSRQWPAWGGTGRITWGLDFPVLGTSARPPSGGVGEVPFGLEASVELEVERRGLSSHDIGLLSPTPH